jgi:DNA recombination protein Rad52
MAFTPEQLLQLQAPLNRSDVRTREQSGRKLSYIEGWHAIAEANRIFGFDAWHRQLTELRMVSERERTIGRDRKPGWGVSYVATVRVMVGNIMRDGTGAGHGIDADLGLAHESAIKEAETDAMKRALMTFGNPFGLALYDKEQREVAADSPAPAPTAKAAPRTRTAPAAAPPPAPAPAPAAAPAASASGTGSALGAELSQDERDLILGLFLEMPAGDQKRIGLQFRQAFGVPDGVRASEHVTHETHRLWLSNAMGNGSVITGSS